MKYTLCITRKCNLQCKYCYIHKGNDIMSSDTIKNIIDFMFDNSKDDDKLDIGFFGGEPLTEFKLIKEITAMIKNHPMYDHYKILYGIVTNGTIYDPQIVDYVIENSASFCISLDGQKEIQDKNRIFKDGTGSFDIVEKNIKKYMDELPLVLVNSVYTPETIGNLGETVKYLKNLGIRQIYINPDFSASWTANDLPGLTKAYQDLKKIYIESYQEGTPVFISLLDGKIASVLRGGYKAEERCQMGVKDFAFSPSGNIFPCERLIEDGDVNKHCIGNVNEGFVKQNNQCLKHGSCNLNSECITCGIKDYCMNWCGCSNYFSSGYYDRVGPFLCASERAAIQTAYEIIEEMSEKYSHVFSEHLSGRPTMNLFT